MCNIVLARMTIVRSVRYYPLKNATHEVDSYGIRMEVTLLAYASSCILYVTILFQWICRCWLFVLARSFRMRHIDWEVTFQYMMLLLDIWRSFWYREKHTVLVVIQSSDTIITVVSEVILFANCDSNLPLNIVIVQDILIVSLCIALFVCVSLELVAYFGCRLLSDAYDLCVLKYWRSLHDSLVI